MKRLLFLALACLSPLAAAQYKGPAVETCRGYALAEERKAAPSVADVQFNADAGLNIARYTRKVGSQFVSSILSGDGALVLKGAPPIEMSFVCLLADERRAVFFYWVPRRDAPALAQCRRTTAPAECIASLQQVAEQDLTVLYAQQLVDAREADSGSPRETRTEALRRSNDAFRAYMEAECARRSQAGGSDAQRACVAELTRRRALDFR